jgi:hypothetical protein
MTNFKDKPDWLDLSAVTKVAHDNRLPDVESSSEDSTLLKAGDSVRTNKEIVVGDSYSIPAKSLGVITACNLGMYKVSFADETVVDVFPEEVEKVGQLSNRTSLFFRTPDRKRVVQPNKWANWLIILKMADRLDKTLTSVGVFNPRLNVLKTLQDNYDQSVVATLFEVAFPTEDNLIKRGTVLVHYDRDNNRIVEPLTVRVSGADHPLTKEAIDKLMASKLSEKGEYIPPFIPQQYAKHDPARDYMIGGSIASKRESFIKQGTDENTYKKAIRDMVKENKAGVFDASNTITAGTEYEFQDNKFRCLETAVPVNRHKELTENPFQTPDDSIRDYQTMDGQDKELDKEDRLEADTFIDTVSSTFNPMEKFGIMMGMPSCVTDMTKHELGIFKNYLKTKSAEEIQAQIDKLDELMLVVSKSRAKDLMDCKNLLNEVLAEK